MGKTLAEKIISAHARRDLAAGDIAIVEVDGAMATDATGPLAIKAFGEMGGERIWDADRFSLVIDHASPAPNERVGNLHRMLRDFAGEQGCHLYDVGEGICHQLMVENAHVRPGDLFVGADSHSPTYGAVNAFGIGVGSTDLAGVLLTGKLWLKVPVSIRITLTGSLPPGLATKDLILYLVGRLKISGATYKAIEFTGPALEGLTLASRMTLANMSAEMGAKAGMVDPSGLELPYDWSPTWPDPDADYAETHTFDVTDLRPQIAAPHSPDNVVEIDALLGRRIDQAFIGSCTNARLEDLHMAARVLEGQRIARHVRLIIAPASKRIFDRALQDGTLQILSEAGASLITSGCGPCVGTHQGVPADGEVVISSTNRNFLGRMGNPKAEIFLASPAVVAASALQGEITSPVELLAGSERDWEVL